MELLSTEVRSILDPGNGSSGTGNAYNTGYSGNINNDGNDLESKPLMVRGEDGEYDATRGKDNR